MSVIRIEYYGDGVQAIVFDRQDSPHNFMNSQVVQELHQAVRVLAADDEVKGVVIVSAKESFLVGGDLRELQGLKTPADAAAIIRDVQSCMREIELAPKPFVAAINGLALGGGLEIALACTYRIAADDPRLKLGLPEVSLGLIPGAGGTQRLPRLIGLAAALPIMIENQQINAEKAQEIGLIDEIVPPGDLIEQAKRSIMLGTAPSDQPWDREGFILPSPSPNSGEGQDVLTAMWSKIGNRRKGLEPAPEAIMKAVEAGLNGSIDEGLKLEQDKFVSVAVSQVVKNKIRTLFLGMNDANGMKDRPKDVAHYNIKSVAVIGVGQMGSGIAYCAAQAGYDVFLLEENPERLEKGTSSIFKRIQGAIERNRMSADAGKKMIARLHPTTTYDDIAAVDMVFEAVSEVKEIKDQVTAAASAVIGGDVPIASNTSTIPISILADSSANKERFIGVHFFAPVDRMKLVEVIKGKQTNDNTLARVLDAIKDMKKTPIVVNDGLGFYTSRVVRAYTGEAFTLLAEGLAPDLIDDVALKAGMPIGPLAMADITSLTLLNDIVISISGDGSAIGLKGLRMTEALERLTAAGRIGKAGGGGIYDYNETGQSAWSGLPDCFPSDGREIDRELIEKRLLFTQSLEAVRAIEDGVIENAIDADIGSVLGWAFPSAHGGVIGLIETIGISQFMADCDELKGLFGGRFEVPKLLRDMNDRNEKFFLD